MNRCSIIYHPRKNAENAKTAVDKAFAFSAFFRGYKIHGKRGVFLFAVAALLLNGCATRRKYWIPRNQEPEIVNMETTGYCRCGKCCGWTRNWKLQPVVAYGPGKGKPKAVGITATGTYADWGTIAADTRYYPFGTIMYVPDYGWGRVEDVGGAIKGQHIDLFFPTHRQALNWGRQWKDVKVWKPR